MSRRSERVKRLQEKATTTITSQAADTEKARDTNIAGSDNGTPLVSPNSDNVQEIPIKKVARRNAARGSSRRAGKLRQMLDMPLDVVLEICSYLHPKDVLSLSRASKDLRKFFMSRNSASIWKAALANLPALPPCPDDLSVPAYVNLVFSENCHICMKRTKDVYWLSRIRLCDKCRKKNEAYDSYPYVDDHVMKMIQPYKLTELVPVVRYLYCSNKHPLVYVPDLEEFLDKLKKTPISRRKSFLSERKRLVESRTMGKDQILRFLYQLKTSRADELEEQRIDRRDQILARLKEAGYEEEVEYLLERRNSQNLYQFNTMPEVRRTQPLTAKGWNNIQGRMIDFIENIRDIRLDVARKATTLQRLGVVERLVKEIASALYERGPSAGEVVLGISEVAQMVDPNHEQFDAHALELVLREAVPKYLKDHRTHRQESLRAYVTECLGLERSTSFDPLSLAAVMWYKCAVCSQALNLDGALYHKCLVDSRAIGRPELEGVVSEEVRFITLNWMAYTQQYVLEHRWQLYQSGFRKAEYLIKELGFDPKTTTVNDVDSADIRVTQLGEEYSISVMDWRSALRLAFTHWILRCRRATETEVSAAKPLEAVREAQILEEDAKRVAYRCSHCDQLDIVAREVVHKHLQETHGIAKPSPADCVDHRPDSAPLFKVHLFCKEKALKYEDSPWVKSAFETGIGAYFDDWKNEDMLS
ncbi:hypothetical protein BC629DRAFT_1536111 [Irpex lacteus]|nr:hypothetical protein BC629DRAFT_1536111 [Irpex lacteus]